MAYSPTASFKKIDLYKITLTKIHINNTKTIAYYVFNTSVSLIWPDLPYVCRFILQFKVVHQTGHVLGCPFGNLATELATRDETIRKKIEQLFLRLQIILRDTLKEAVDRGELETIDVDATAQAMFAYFEGIMLFAKTSNNPKLVQQLLPAASQILIKSTH